MFSYGLPLCWWGFLCCDSLGGICRLGVTLLWILCDEPVLWNCRVSLDQSSEGLLVITWNTFSSLRVAGGGCIPRVLIENYFRTLKNSEIISKYNFLNHHSQPERNKDNYGKILLLMKDWLVLFDLPVVFHPLWYFWCLVFNTKVKITTTECYFLLLGFFTSVFSLFFLKFSFLNWSFSSKL